MPDLCAAGPHCVGGGVDLYPAADRATLCTGCLNEAERAIQALPADWRDLEQLLPPSLGVWGDGQPHAAGKAEAPIPLNLHAEELQANIWWSLTAWEEVVRDRAGLSDVPRRPPPRRLVSRFVVAPNGDIRRAKFDATVEHPTALARPMRPGPADVVRAARILAPRVAMLSTLGPVEMVSYPLAAADQLHQHGGLRYAHVPGWQGVLDLTRLHRRAVATLGLTQPVRLVPGDCSNCGRPDLRQNQPRWAGDEQPVACGGCGQHWSYQEYERYVGLWKAAA
jgi:hypothetical protein